jgi:glycosyltransferase involved in cell wall biosynthesis
LGSKHRVAEPRLKVALYYPWVYVHGGPERVISELLVRSRHQWTIFTNRYEPESTFPALKQADIVQLAEVSVKRTLIQTLRSALRLVSQKLPLTDHQVLVVFCEGLGDLVVVRTRVPSVCLCLTPLRVAFDPFYQERYFEMAGGRVWRQPLVRLASFLFRMIDRRLWTRYERVFAISEEVRKRIAKARLYPADKVQILYPGVDISCFTPTGVYSHDFLIPGRIMWTKNLELAIAAFRLLLERRPDLAHFTLTMAGYVDAKSQSYIQKLRQMAEGVEQIRFIVAPTDQELTGLSSACYAVVYPPFNEDWGLAPIEGMALEKPVIAVNRGGPSESVLDGETGLLVDPTPAAFASAMERLADDFHLVQTMGKKARQRAAEFNWTQFCERLDACVEELAGVSAAPDALDRTPMKIA